MAERVIVTLHLPLEMGAAARIAQAIAREFPDAVVDQTSGGSTWAIRADDDPFLSKADRRRRVAEARRRG